jgi:hypothetical protein
LIQTLFGLAGHLVARFWDNPVGEFTEGDSRAPDFSEDLGFSRPFGAEIILYEYPIPWTVNVQPLKRRRYVYCILYSYMILYKTGTKVFPLD